MSKLSELLLSDVRFREGLTACMNCGICTAICPAAEFYNYDPRQICVTVQSKDEEKIGELLRSEMIWYCGQCMSCKPRCPRGNIPGLIITVLRKLSQELGYFTESEKGRQQFAIKRVVGESILKTGYCVHPEVLTPEKHPEQGPVWRWYFNNLEEVVDRVGGNYKKDGPGALRLIREENLEEVRKIFEVTGGNLLHEQIESSSIKKAKRMGYTDVEIDSDYIDSVYTANENNHQK